ncbi:hypothetical protein PHISP_05257 [Aspergillus sp. HF37]|nr:hypothetical protein PHISP_05257 [Aspergillus sp. HF37]
MLKYDIPTLLALRQNSRAEIDKFRAQALGNTMPKQRKANLSALSERSANRSRNPSNLSYSSQPASSTSRQPLRLPSRQPNNPPRGALAQTDSGFARFLKQHSSPKHKRVTAGGRIVPMDPSIPAPKMNLLANAQNTKDYGTLPRGERGHRARSRSVKDTEKGANVGDTSKASSLPAEALADQTKLLHGNGSLGQYLHAPGLFPSFPSASVTPTMLMPPSIPFPLGSQLLQPEQKAQEGLKVFPNCKYGLGGDQFAWLPNTNLPLGSQSSAASFISASGYPHPPGSGSASEFSTDNNFLPMGSSASSAMSPGLDYFYPAFGAIGYPFIGQQVPLANQPLPFQGASKGKMDLASLQGATKEYEAISAQLSRIDRYMAVHTWDLDPRSKKLLVEQRMSLVRELDAVRLYKEQLESIFGQAKPGRAETRKKPGAQASTGQPPPGGCMENQAAQAPKFSASAVPVTLPGSNPMATFQQVLQMNEQFPAAFQWNDGGGLYSFDNGTGFGHMGAGSELSCEPRSSYHGVSSSTASLPGWQSAQVPATKLTGAETSCGGDGWTTPTKSAPPGISRIYRKIEEATKRGDSIGPLIQELAAATTHPAGRNGQERSGAQHPAPKQNSKPSVTNESGLSAPAHRATGHTIGRLWKSESGVHTLANNAAATPYETDDEDGAGSWSTSSATTDSWATIQEGVKHHLMGGSLTNENNEDKKMWSKDQQVLSHAAPVRAQAGNLHEAASLNRKGNTARESGSESTRHSGSQLLTRYFGKDSSTGSHKSGPLTASQSVNAHAFLPPLDGAADSPGGHPDNARFQSETAPELNQKKRPWYQREERARPSPAVLREFFRRIEEEERNMMHWYQATDPTPWQLG